MYPNKDTIVILTTNCYDYKTNGEKYIRCCIHHPDYILYEKQRKNLHGFELASKTFD